MRFATVLASFVLAVSGFAQAPPKVQLALVVDQFGGSGYGAVHRIDTRTGKYLGNFGQGSMFYPSAIAVQPTTKVVFVDDTQALKKFDMSTGRYLGLVVRNTALGGSISAMRFGPDGSLYAAVNPDGFSYDLVRINPTTGAVVKSLSPQPTGYATKLSIGFRPNGNVTVFNSSGSNTYEDQYNAGTLSPINFPAVDGNDAADFRTSTDVFLRFDSSGGIYSGFGDFVHGSFVTISGVVGPLFAEGPLDQTSLLGTIGGSVFLLNFDTSDVAFLAGVVNVASFSYSSLVDMAIYAK